MLQMEDRSSGGRSPEEDEDLRRPTATHPGGRSPADAGVLDDAGHGGGGGEQWQRKLREEEEEEEELEEEEEEELLSGFK